MHSLGWRIRVLLTTAGILCLDSLPAAAQSLDSPPVLRAGDVVQIQVWRQPEYSGEFEITSEGTIVHPLYSELKVAGREIADIEGDLYAFLGQYVEEPNFVVEVFFPVPVGGEVRLPDIYRLRPRATVARVIAIAGGPTRRGRLDRVILRRNGQSHVIDVTDPDIQLRDLEIRSGDEIVVERRVDVFREYIAPTASIVGALAAVLRLMRVM